MNERRTVELVLPIQLMRDVVLNGADDGRERREALELLALALRQLFEGQEDRRDKVMRRSRRAYEAVTQPWRGAGAPVGRLGLVAFYFLSPLADAEYFVIHPESAFGRALDLILPALEPAARDTAMDAEAQEGARVMLRQLQGLGYFQGAPS